MANGCEHWKHQNKIIIPAKITIPKHHSVFLSTQPRSSIFPLSRGYLLSLQNKVPVNLSSLLFGGSQITSPEGTKDMQAYQHQLVQSKYNHSARQKSLRCPQAISYISARRNKYVKHHLTIKVNQFCNISQIWGDGQSLTNFQIRLAVRGKTENSHLSSVLT